MRSVAALSFGCLLALVGFSLQCSTGAREEENPSSGAAAAGGFGDGGAPDTAGRGGASAGFAGDASAGEGAAGDGGAPSEPSFLLGADISSAQEAVDGGAVYVDTDGRAKPLLDILSNHGFNAIRLRTFVDPAALYGYANPTGEAAYRRAEPYCDTPHTIEVAREVKRAGMSFLLDLHYSDNWADPGKQIIPEAWRGARSLTELASQLRSYTSGVVAALVEAGARPDMVQIGNEITPGLLIHVPSQAPAPDPWGNIDMRQHIVNGSAANWTNLATLLKEAIRGVKDVDPSIRILLHLENTRSFPAIVSWVNNARSRGVEFDVLGLSCYTLYQGEPAIWEDTLDQLVDNLPGLEFVIAEYNPERTRANQIVRDLPDGRGRGTFFWEPTQGSRRSGARWRVGRAALHVRERCVSRE